MINFIVKSMIILSFMSFATACSKSKKSDSGVAPASVTPPPAPETDPAPAPAPTVEEDMGQLGQFKLFKSQERTMLDTAIEKAKLENKKVLIKIAAGWCGPCLALDEEIAKRRGEFDNVLTKYEYVVFEQMHWHSQSGLYDFLPNSAIVYFPSLFVYDPVTKAWSYLGESSFDGVIKTLKEYETHGNVSQREKETLEKLFANPNFANEVKFTGQSQAGAANLGMLSNALLTVIYENDAAEANKFYDTINALILKHPSNFDMQSLQYLINAVSQMRVVRGDISATDLQKTISTPASVRAALNYEFRAQVAMHMRDQSSTTSGYDFCVSKMATATTTVKPAADAELATFKKAYKAAKTVADAMTDAKKKSARLAQLATALESATKDWDYRLESMKATCNLVGAQTGKVDSAAVKSQFNGIKSSSLPASFRGALMSQMMWVLASAGAFTEAIPLLKATRDSDAQSWQGSVDNYTTELQKLRDSLTQYKALLKAEKAAATPDQKKITALETEIKNGDSYVPQYEAYIIRLKTLKNRVVKAHDEVLTAWEAGTTTVAK